MNWYSYNREEEEERLKRLGIIPQYINTPYGIARNPALEPQEKNQTSLSNQQQTQNSYSKPESPQVQASLSNSFQQQNRSQQQEPSLGQKLEGLAKIGVNAVTLNQMDEAVGLLVGGVNMVANAFRDNPTSYMDAFKKGYQIARDDWRNNMQQARQAWPTASAAFDTVSSIAAPGSFVKAAKTAPLAMRATRGMYNNMLGGAIDGIGKTEENTPLEYAKNIANGVVSNYAGHKTTNRLIGRGGDDFAQAVTHGLATQGYNKMGEKIIDYAERNNPFSAKTPEEEEEERRRRMGVMF